MRCPVCREQKKRSDVLPVKVSARGIFRCTQDHLFEVKDGKPVRSWEPDGSWAAIKAGSERRY